MTKAGNFIRSLLIAGSLLVGARADSQNNYLNKTIRVVDPIMKLVDSTQLGLSNVYAILKDNASGRQDTFRTNSQGYADIITGVNDGNHEDSKNNLNVKIYKDNRGINFENAPRVKIHNILGQEIKDLNNESWDLTNNRGAKVSNGVYPFLIYDNQNGKEEVIGTGMLNSVDGSLAYKLSDVKLRKKAGHNSLNKLNSARYTLEIRDELNNDIGEFNDIVHNVNSIDSLLNEYEMIYNFSIDHPVDQNFLTNVRRNVGSLDDANGDSRLLSWLRAQRPYKIFKNQGSSLPVFDQALDDLLRSIEESTQMNYRGRTIPRQTLFRPVPAYDSTGINMDYSTNLDQTVITRWPSPGLGLSQGAVKNCKVKINGSNIGNYRILQSMAHEIGHHTIGGAYQEPSWPGEIAFPIPSYRMREIILLQTLKDYTNLSLSVAE